MKIKKLITMLLCIVMCLGLVACGDKDSDKEDESSKDKNTKFNKAQELLADTYNKEKDINFTCDVTFSMVIGTDLSDIYDGGDGEPSWMDVKSSSEYIAKTDGKITYTSGTVTSDSLGFESEEEIEQYTDLSDPKVIKIYELVDSDKGLWTVTETKNSLNTSSIVGDKSFVDKLKNAKVIEENDSQYTIEADMNFGDLQNITGELTDGTKESYYKGITAKVVITIDKNSNKISFFKCDMTEAMSNMLKNMSSSQGLGMRTTECIIEMKFRDYGTTDKIEIPKEVFDNLTDKDDINIDFNLEDLEDLEFDFSNFQ